MLLNWYSFSITWFWDGLGKLCMKSFHLLQKLDMLPNVFYILLLTVLFFGWMVVMRNYYKGHRDKGIIQ